MSGQIPGKGNRAVGAVMPRYRNYPLLGALLAIGAPSGLLLAHSIASGSLPTMSWILNEITTQPLTYGYVTFSTLALLALLGYRLGRKSDHLRALANTDPLTGLHNLRRFNERLEEEMNRSVRYRTPLSLMAVDLDRLKVINDHLGHKAGDAALLAVATSLLGSVRVIDITARIGGDEFAVLFPQTTAAEAVKQAGRFAKRLARRFGMWVDPLSVSVGVAEFDSTVEARREEFLMAADTALYQAKAAGGGRTIVARSNRATPDNLPIVLHPKLRLLDGGSQIGNYR